jgi:tRNA-specific 2-thiouridylase
MANLTPHSQSHSSGHGRSAAQTKVLVALSGGLMSGVVAALLKHQGYQVVGLHLQYSAKAASRMPALEKMTHRLGMNLINVDVRGEWEAYVRDHVVHEMALGRKPEPDRTATHQLLLSTLLAKADELKCAMVATGHLARVAVDPATNTTRLLRTLDGDQSALLYQIAPKTLGRFILPMGDLSHSAVEKLGAELGLEVEHLKSAAHLSEVGVSGIAKEEYYQIAASTIPANLFPPGQIKLTDGLVVGEHAGVYRYTTGSRRGLPQLRLPPLMKPEGFVVTALDPGTHWVRPVDGLKLLKCHAFLLDVDAPGSASRFVECQVTLFENDLVYVEFKKPQKIAGPGQSIVFYQEDEVIGGAILCQTRTPHTS